ncbi:MAG: (Fe-S)-binding protein [Candidatus Heimdallarchaeota archaeon]|nr:(Fe-S)-binding protein [Candidatus Heimdallarchaeota archaeon]
MGHKNGHEKNSYLQLQQRLDKAPQGAPLSKSLLEILKVLFTEEEAQLVSVLPINFVTAERAAKIWKKTPKEAEKILDTLAGKGLLLDGCQKDKRTYILAPPMAGFFEFSIMRTDGKFNREVLSDLYYQYLNQEDDFLFAIFATNTPIDRVFVQEETIQPNDYSIVLDYERASKVIDNASCITVGTCYCRHKMEHQGKACDKPQDVCLTFNGAAQSLSKHGIAKEITKEEAHKILDRCVDLGLVQIGDNVQEGVAWICNNKKIAQIDYERCFGCGVCARNCKKDVIIMNRREELMHTPQDSFERVVRMALDTGKLQNLLYDNQHLWTHKMLQRFVGVILNLGPIRRRMANHQLQSKFIKKARKLANKRKKRLIGKKIFN